MWIRMMRVRNPNMPAPVMTIEESRRTQRPYRYGMILLCFGALANWLGLAENYAEPVRYLGVACIIAGALLICTAMCCWLHTPQRTASSFGPEEGNNTSNTTAPSEIRCEKPPDYDTVATLMPPTYDDAIKLNPSVFLVQSTSPIPSSSTAAAPSYPMPPPPTPADHFKESSSSSHYPINAPPPIYTITTAMPNEVVSYDNEQQSSSSRSRDVPTSRSPSAQSAPVIR